MRRVDLVCKHVCAAGETLLCVRAKRRFLSLGRVCPSRYLNAKGRCAV